MRLSPGDPMTIRLSTETIEVHVAPERGADIVRFIHRPSGINIFSESPTGDVTNTTSAWGDSMTHWINGYPGGWQILLPNAGPERHWEGVSQGFHGEASLASWTIQEQSAQHCELETSLLTAPLRVHRTVTVIESRLTVTDQITNLAPQPTTFRLCQHPAFGPQFLDDASYLVTTAGRFIADAENPGSMALRNATGAPAQVLPTGPFPHTVSLPGPGSGNSLFGALTEFVPVGEENQNTSVAFVSPTRNLAATISWDASVFPYTWFWIEANAMPTWPWFQRLYSVAVEPANTLPGSGPGPDHYERGGPGTTLDAGKTLSSVVSISINAHTSHSH